MYSKQFLALDEARAVVEAALAEAARDPDRPVAIAVVDPVGDLIYFVRQDRAAPHCNMLAISKAYTAVRFRRDTADLSEHFQKQSWFSGVGDFVDPDYTPVPGGMCLKASDGTLLGAIGISGRTSGDKIQDTDLGKAGQKALSL